MTPMTILSDLLIQQLKPLVRKIDCQAYYPRDFLLQLGKNGLYRSEGLTESEMLTRDVQIVEKVAEVCMTTGFNLWCHLAALTYIRHSDNAYLKQEILPRLEQGETLGATGLSNPMKYYAGLETLHLQAEETETGYVINGTLPAVSNLGEGHWFGVIASVNDQKRIMALISCEAAGLTLQEKPEFLALNGTATYACVFKDVEIPKQWIISENSDQFCDIIRPTFILYQIPLGVGVTEAAIRSIDKVEKRQNGCNQYLAVQSNELQEEVNKIRQDMLALACATPLHIGSIIETRYQAVQLTLKATQAEMIHNGSPGYLQKSDPSRRLRETYFFANLTPTVKQLEKMRALQVDVI